MATKKKTGYRIYRDYFKNWIRLECAHRKRNKVDAKVIVVTGSSAKSTTTSLLAHVLKSVSNAQTSSLPNDEVAAARVISSISKADDYFVVEAGAEKSGNLAKISEVLRPDIAIITMVALEHKSVFRSVEGVMQEKSEVVAAVQPKGFALLNADDPLVMQMADRTSQRVVTFGRSAQADYRVENITAQFPQPFTMRMFWGNESLHLSARFVGEHFWLPMSAAAAAAIELGVPKHVVAERVSTFEPVFGRCNVVAVPDGPTFILDTTKAPWHSLRLAFNIIEKAHVSRKRIVLGHISDYSGNNSKYSVAYRMARDIADEVIFVGMHAHRSKASTEDRASGRIREFSSAKLVADYIESTAVPGELVLLKGSADLHLERIALAYQEEVKCWAQSCGKKTGCKRCGLYLLPFAEHGGQLRSLRKTVFRRNFVNSDH